MPAIRVIWLAVVPLANRRPDQGAQEVLEGGFDLVDAGHVGEVSGAAIWLLSVDGILGWIW